MSSLLINASFAPETLANYTKSFRDFVSFTRSIGAGSLPATSKTIQKYISYCFIKRRKYGSIRSAVTAVSFFHKMNDSPDPTKHYRVTLLFKGVKRNSKKKTKLLPISHGLLEKILDKTYNILTVYDKKCLQASFLLLYYGCLRIGELVKSGKPNHMIRAENVRFLYKGKNLKGVRITLDSYKHSDEPVTFKIKCAAKQYCPVRALLAFFHIRGSGDGPVFIKSNSKMVTRDFIASHLKSIIKSLGLNDRLYNTHSFRIGRASDMAKKGVPEQIIKRTGRWESTAYTRYIRFEVFEVPVP